MKKILVVCILATTFGGCKSNPAGPSTEPPAPLLAKAVYVLNEGDYTDPSGARLTVYDKEHDSTYQDVFEGANAAQHLGSLGDDMKFYNGKAYILMSHSENLDIVSLTDNHLQVAMTYAGETPHDLVIDSSRNKAFITRLYKNSLLVVNLTTLAVIDSISVGSNPQGMLLIGSQLYVCNSGYGSDSTVSVIDAVTNVVKKTLRVGDGPSSAVLASDGNVWVACTGNAFGTPSTKGKIFIINPATNSVQDSVIFDENLFGLMAAGSDGSVYVIGISSGSFSGGPVDRLVVSTKALTKNFIAGTYYGIGVDEATGDIYAADAKEFAAEGQVSIFKNDGTARTPASFKTRRGPGVICFKR